MSNTSEMGSNPKWLDEFFLENILRASEDDQKLTATSHELTRATAAGDNYSSDMYRIKISFTRNRKKETRLLILKAVPDKEEMSKMMEDVSIYDRESLVLSKILPKMYNLLNTVSRNKFQPFSPKCFYSQSQPSVIVMEDLKEQGFKLGKRLQGLDMKHSLLVMKQIARYHAASVALYEKNSEVFMPARDCIFLNERLRDTVDMLFGKNLKDMAAEVNGWPDCKERFGGKLQKIAEKAVVTVIELVKKQDDDDFKCFTHGDLWLNNIMFRYSDSNGEVEEVRFVDYQVSYLGSPVMDLLYFLHTSVSLELLDKQPILIQEYHNTLAGTMALLGYEHMTPSLAQLHQQMDKRGIYAVIVTGSVLPFVLADKSKLPDIEEMLKGESALKFSEQYRKTMRKLLPEFERKGWL